MMQYITNLHYHKVEETIVSQKILICHEKVECNLKTDGIQFFSFHNFYIFVCKLKQIYFYFSSRDVCYFLLKINEYIEKKIKIYFFSLHGKNMKITKRKIKWKYQLFHEVFFVTLLFLLLYENVNLLYIAS